MEDYDVFKTAMQHERDKTRQEIEDLKKQFAAARAAMSQQQRATALTQQPTTPPPGIRRPSINIERLPSPYAVKQSLDPQEWEDAIRENRAGILRIPNDVRTIAASVQYILSHFLICEMSDQKSGTSNFVVAHPSLPASAVGEPYPILKITLYSDGGIGIRCER